MTHPSLAAEDFDAAKSVYETLKQIPRERQERILRWISEGFGISVSPGRIIATSPAPDGGGAPVGSERGGAGSGTDIKAFVAAKAPQSDNHFAAVVAYYYRFEAPAEQRREAIDSTALQEAARLAGRKRLAKPSDTLNNAKKSGLLDAAERGAFRINSVGENLVAMALPGSGSVVARSAPRPRKAKKVKKAKKSS